jgi:hypothetical protein
MIESQTSTKIMGESEIQTIDNTENKSKSKTKRKLDLKQNHGEVIRENNESKAKKKK